MNEEPPLGRDILDAWRVNTVSKKLEDDTWYAFVCHQYRMFVLKITGLAAVSVSIVFLLYSSYGSQSVDAISVSQDQVAYQRTSWSIGDRAVAVAEPGSQLSWNIDVQGAALVRQTSGEVFFRINPGGIFEVETPVGSVRALGTCFRVEIKKMKLNKEWLKGSALGAGFATVAFVTVYEGRVALSNGQELGAGESTAILDASKVDTLELDKSEPKAEIALKHQVEQQADKIRELQATISTQRSRLEALDTIKTKASVVKPEVDTWPEQHLDTKFDQEVRDDAWATPQEYYVASRVTDYMGIAKENFHVECRTNCCDMQFDVERMPLFWGAIRDVKSDIGIGIGQSGWEDMDIQPRDESEDGLSHIYICNTRVPLPEGVAQHELPNRGEERQRMLERAEPALNECRGQLSGPLTVEMTLSIDMHGAITQVSTHATPIGEPAAKCVEEALLVEADFAPAVRSTWFPIRLTLQPD